MKTKIGLSRNSCYFLLLILIISCDPYDNKLKVFNNSKFNIYFYYTCDSSLNDLVFLGNGFIKNSDNDSMNINSYHFVEKKSFKKFRQWGINGWKHYIKECKVQEINFYFFCDSVLRKYSDIEIKQKKLYAKHIMYTVKELEKNNWTVTFP